MESERGLNGRGWGLDISHAHACMLPPPPSPRPGPSALPPRAIRPAPPPAPPFPPRGVGRVREAVRNRVECQPLLILVVTFVAPPRPPPH